jgi:hypothetical protein
MLTPRSRSKYILTKQGAVTFITCATIALSSILITSIFSGDSCRRDNADCIKLISPGKETPFFAVPSGVFGSIIGAFSGALFTFSAFNLLEAIKLDREPRPQLTAGFEPEEDQSGSEPDYTCLIVNSSPFYVEASLPQGDKTEIDVGTASYLRIKVVNNGSIVCRNVRAYLTRIDVKTKNGWSRLGTFREPMALLWAYEGRQDYIIPGHGIDLPSKATSFADVLVSYDNSLNPRDRFFDYTDNQARRDANQEAASQNVWYLKLKTKRQPANHRYILEVVRSSSIAWKLTVEVYGDQSEPSKVELFVTHAENDPFLEVYTDAMREKKRLLLHCDKRVADRLNQARVDFKDFYTQF